MEQLRDIDKVGKDEYLIKITSALDIFIRTEGGIQGNQRSSTYEKHRGVVGSQHKELTGHTFAQHKGGT